MNSKVVLILVLIIALVAGVGVAILLLTRQSTPIAPAPTATPIVDTTVKPVLTAVTTNSILTAGQESVIDIFLDTKSTKIEGFQFIATVGGTALPAIVDADPSTDGIQVGFENIPELTISTNSVVEQDGSYIVRYAMVATDESTGFESSTPVKIASVTITPGTGGSVSLAFNTQNSRARSSEGGDEVLLAVTDGTYTVSQASADGSTASSSGALTASVASTPTPTPSSQSASPFCLASCVTDNDCAAGLVCETDRCVNPACPTSQTCGCTQTTSTTSGTPTPIPVTATPQPTLIAQAATPTPDASLESELASGSGETLPQAGSVEITFLLLGGGLLFLGCGVYLASARATV